MCRGRGSLLTPYVSLQAAGNFVSGDQCPPKDEKLMARVTLLYIEFAAGAMLVAIVAVLDG